VIGHIPDQLAQILSPMLEGDVRKIIQYVGTITYHQRRTGRGIELPMPIVVYGP